jgi:hypothetical protein
MSRRSGPARSASPRRSPRFAAKLASLFAVVALGAGCFGQRERLRPIVSSGPGERLDIRVSLYAPSSEAEKTTPRVDPDTGKPRSPIRHGEALASIALAHLSQVCAIVELTESAKAPLDPNRDAILLEVESASFSFDEATGAVEWTVAVRVSDALRLRFYEEFKGRGEPGDWSRPGARLPKGDPKWTRLELAANSAMASIVGQLWLELKRDN